MRQAEFDGKGSCIRWTETPGAEPARVYVHGLGSISAVYHAHIAARPELAGRRSLFVDLPGHGVSDRPEHFGYTLEDHADALAVALDAAQLTGVELIAHSMGGSVALVLAHRRPELVSRLVLTEANLDASPPATAGSSRIDAYEEDDFVAGAHARVLEKVGPLWAATMRLADPRALHRSAAGLRRGSVPMMREILEGLPIDRVYLQGELSGELEGRSTLEATGVRVVTVPGAGHNVMLDNPDAFVAVVAGSR
ncbi:MULTISPECIES: alpha/beta hydrolase [unclassified Streptomyces]|uniref:alpha/beta fold hydrolase n=1 Tax=unclassified Streptomyces TaxID=2593676 RepID=UPI002473A436|nr:MULTISPECIES: alpha/beta hydrolase [unclassified Streptomyces]MDH6448020.1 pimeloyl-ACP methyl ester carboxylesterase [Streptomyces sp. SAI-119]MDH6501258.1 pimeloyl-ACP methyl ester carboxylesterase [Streptomyces sp. SAI-149]GLP64215.1 alpha/beta hydrolase [Streptomyces sp. TUS-ST3]